MDAIVENLLGGYETGRISRRDLVATLSALVMGSAATANAQSSAPFPARSLNHVTVYVSNTERSIEFYTKMFGLSVLTKQHGGGTAVLPLAASGNYLILHGPEVLPSRQGRTITPHFNHICFGIDSFEPAAAKEKLEAMGHRVTLNMRPAEESVPPGKGGPAAELLFRDPDNLLIQISDVRYRGATGILGDTL